MATTTSKSKAKTKTTKKAAAKKPATTSKTTKRPVTKAVSSKKTTKKPETISKSAIINKRFAVKRPKQDVTFARVRSMQIFSAGIFGLLAVAAAWLMSTNAVGYTLTYAVPDLLADPSGNTLLPASQEILTVQVRWLLVAVIGVSALFPLWYAFRASKKYEAYVTYGAVKLRWIEIGVTFGLLAELVALVSGLQSLLVLKTIFAATATYALLAWVTERFHVARQSTKALFVGTALVGLAPALIIGSFALDSLLYGEVVYAWHLYVAQAALILGFVALLKNQFKQIKLQKKWLSNVYVERNYVAINLLTKVVIAGVLIVGFQR